MPRVTAKQIVDRFSASTFANVTSGVPVQPLRYRDFFPLAFNTGLTFGSIEAQTGAIMAPVVAKGSRAPRISRLLPKGITGEIPKIEVARDQDEEDFWTIQKLQDEVQAAISRGTSNAGAESQLNNAIYGDAIDTVMGVNARLEYIAKQIASTGKVSLDATNNSQGVQGLEFDFGTNVVTPDKFWDDEESDPMKDMSALSGANYGITDLATARKILDSKKIKALVYGNSNQDNSVTPTLEQANDRLRAFGLPQIVVWETEVQQENKSGEIETVTGWESNNILFVPDLEMGNTQYAVLRSSIFSAQNRTIGGVTRNLVDDFILSQIWGEMDPERLSTKATAYAFPVMNNISRSNIVKAFETAEEGN